MHENVNVMDRLDRSIHAHATKAMLGVASPALFAARPEFAWMDRTSPSMTAEDVERDGAIPDRIAALLSR
ncbi:hypothetical protein [Labrys wisconsinensis]|uniref:Uncharacterized protein n=1 Tax=Labrys wisconsinensis TaxID=425677 RepID=A0ABU0IYN4_9HYPH|nr:hypothetical protein [Labrys wisconsinensis]MDQ0467120.1 hypothetical protein [Labrys wisconsinensis]